MEIGSNLSDIFFWLVTVKREEQLRREILLRKREIRLRHVKERPSFDNI